MAVQYVQGEYERMLSGVEEWQDIDVVGTNHCGYPNQHKNKAKL